MLTTTIIVFSTLANLSTHRWLKNITKLLCFKERFEQYNFFHNMYKIVSKTIPSSSWCSKLPVPNNRCLKIVCCFKLLIWLCNWPSILLCSCCKTSVIFSSSFTFFFWFTTKQQDKEKTGEQRMQFLNKLKNIQHRKGLVYKMFSKSLPISSKVSQVSLLGRMPVLFKVDWPVISDQLIVLFGMRRPAARLLFRRIPDKWLLTCRYKADKKDECGH